VQKSHTRRCVGGTQLHEKQKAAGPSGVTSDLLKVCGIESAKRLASMVNDMLQGNSMPESWRRSDLIHFYKGKDRCRVLWQLQKHKTT